MNLYFDFNDFFILKTNLMFVKLIVKLLFLKKNKQILVLCNIILDMGPTRKCYTLVKVELKATFLNFWLI